MRIRLDRDDNPVFATVRNPMMTGDWRTLMVKINGKPFSAWVNYDTFLTDDPNYMRALDEQLVATMERMFEKVFMDACAAIPEGTDLLVKDKS